MERKFCDRIWLSKSGRGTSESVFLLSQFHFFYYLEFFYMYMSALLQGILGTLLGLNRINIKGLRDVGVKYLRGALGTT